jgi:uncharacterized protein (DUF2235 family)
MPKRIVVCCDGTWNKLDDNSPTNVNRMAQAIALGQPAIGEPEDWEQIVYYQEGVGTKWYDRIPGGAFGAGIDEKIKVAYAFLAQHYTHGDEIYLFGFSRGAYTARSLGGLIHTVGLVPHASNAQIDQAYQIYRERDQTKRHRQGDQFKQTHPSEAVSITLLACWDTVGSLGIPDLIPQLPIDYWLNLPYRFHDTKLSTTIQHALHAAALDEQRRVFSLTPMDVHDSTKTKLEQSWFTGDHGGVGSTAGGILADVTFDWMIKSIGALGLGLRFKANMVDPDRVMPENVIHHIPDQQLQDLAEKTANNFFATFGLQPRQVDGPTTAENLSQTFHPTVNQLWCRQPGYPYRPSSIAKSDWKTVFERQCDRG